MTMPDPESWDLMTACLVERALSEPWVQWGILFALGLLRDEPGDRETILPVLERKWDPDAADLSVGPARVVAAAREAAIALDSAVAPDPGGETARRLLDRLERKREERQSRFRNLLAAEWEKVDSRSEHVDWSYDLMPALPAKWPQDRDGRLFFYALARGRDRRHPDTWHTAPVWARVETVREEETGPKVVRYLSELVPQKRPAIIIPRFTQREITTRELDRWMWDTFEALLSTPGLPDEEATETRCLREYYSMWHGRGGSAKVREHHEPFLDWLLP
jgi:hypothetical protein